MKDPIHPFFFAHVCCCYTYSTLCGVREREKEKKQVQNRGMGRRVVVDKLGFAGTQAPPTASLQLGS